MTDYANFELPLTEEDKANFAKLYGAFADLRGDDPQEFVALLGQLMNEELLRQSVQKHVFLAIAMGNGPMDIHDIAKAAVEYKVEAIDEEAKEAIGNALADIDMIEAAIRVLEEQGLITHEGGGFFRISNAAFDDVEAGCEAEARRRTAN